MSEQPSAGVPTWSLGDRLRKSLEFAGLKVNEMADYLEVERNTVGNYIAGRTRISGASLRLWAMRTGVPIEWLRTGEIPQPEPPAGGEECAIRDSNPEPADWMDWLADLRLLVA